MSAEFSHKEYINKIVNAYREKVGPQKGAFPGEKWVTNLDVETHEGILALPWSKSDGKPREDSDPDPPLALRDYVARLEEKGLDVRINSKAYGRNGDLLPDAIAVFIKPKESEDKD